MASQYPITAASNAPVFQYSGTLVRPDAGNVDFDVTSDLVFGSSSTEDTTDAAEDARIVFDKDKGAIRAGSVSGTQWDDANRGVASAAFGENTTASGDYSSASGLNTTAGGDYSWAAGEGSTVAAAHDNAFVWSDATARSSTAANEVTFGAAGGFRVFAGGEAGSTINLDGPVTMPGKLTVGGIIDPTGLVCDEQPSVPGGTPGAAKGTFWIRDDAPNVPMFTNDAGTDFVLNTDATASLASAGGTETLVNDGAGPALSTKGLTAGTGISLTGAASAVTVANTSPATSVTLASAGGTETLVVDGTGPTLSNKGLTAGTGISLFGAATDVTVTNTSPATSVTLGSVAVGETLVSDGVGPALATKGLLAGTGISLLGAATDVIVTNSSPATSVTLSSAGGTSLITDGTGAAMTIKGLSAGTGMNLNNNATNLGVEAESYQGRNDISPIGTGNVNAITSGDSNFLNSLSEGCCIGGSSSCSITRENNDGPTFSTIHSSSSCVIIGERCENCGIMGSARSEIRTDDLGGGSGFGDQCVVVGSDTCFIGTTLSGTGNLAGIMLGHYSSFDAHYNDSNATVCATMAARNTAITGTTASCAWIAGNGFTHSSSSSNSVWAGGAGHANSQSATRSAWIGGNNNDMTVGGSSAANSVCLGGFSNDIEDNVESCAWVGGHNNDTDGDMEHTIVLGSDTTAGHDGCLLFSDSAGGTRLQTTANHRVHIRSSNGCRWYTNTSNSSGVQMNGGASSWASICTRSAKENFRRPGPGELMAKIERIPVYLYNYKTRPPEQVCVGPTAEDWHEQFGCEEVPAHRRPEDMPPGPAKDPKTIETMDLAGVLMGGVQDVHSRRDATFLGRGAVGGLVAWGGGAECIPLLYSGALVRCTAARSGRSGSRSAPPIYVGIGRFGGGEAAFRVVASLLLGEEEPCAISEELCVDAAAGDRWAARVSGPEGAEGFVEVCIAFVLKAPLVY